MNCYVSVNVLLPFYAALGTSFNITQFPYICSIYIQLSNTWVHFAVTFAVPSGSNILFPSLTYSSLSENCVLVKLTKIVYSNPPTKTDWFMPFSNCEPNQLPIEIINTDLVLSDSNLIPSLKSMYHKVDPKTAIFGIRFRLYLYPYWKKMTSQIEPFFSYPAYRLCANFHPVLIECPIRWGSDTWKWVCY